MPERKVYRFRIDPTADQEAALLLIGGGVIHRKAAFAAFGLLRGLTAAMVAPVLAGLLF